ncbi:MAG: FAD-dependent thymidylate synthase [Planctomycetes bacterium]|nr:FAD-dependent thymidylate synthase [Planctomycetota bacterium]
MSRKELYGDGIGFVEEYDFSTANSSKEARIEAITQVASVCYDKEAKNKIALFNMLESESLGLPSTSFEFVPVLIKSRDYSFLLDEIEMMRDVEFPITLDIEKYGEWIHTNNDSFLLTNLRACLNVQKKYEFEYVDFKTYFNTSPEEIQIIKENHKTFFQKVPIFVARQLVRHRVSFQELSRRYTDNERSPVEFYAKDDEFKAVKISLYRNHLRSYKHLIDKGAKPEDTRAVLPQATYTKIWSAFQPDSFDNFIKLRTKKSAQSEIIELAEGMR